MTEETYRVGVVGLTGIAANRPSTDPQAVLNTPMPSSHVSSYAALPQTHLVAVCDLRPELFDQFKQRWGDVFPDVRTYTDYREMIETENLNILSVVTSDNRHADIVVDAASAGLKGIICEKPLATTVDDCNRMIKACEKNGVRAFINGSKGQASGSRIEVIGSKARLDVENDAVTLWSGEGVCERLDLPPHMKSGITACISELIRVMEGGGELISPGREGKKVVEIIVGFLKSQERGNVRVDLPLPPGN